MSWPKAGELPNGRAEATWRDISRPDWCIIGAPLPDGTGVALLASSKLTKAQLGELAVDTLYPEQITAGWIRTGVFLHLGIDLDDFVMAAGPTYADALEELFKSWVPPVFRPRPAQPEDEQPAIEGQVEP
jgi:hypothetical protein